MTCIFYVECFMVSIDAAHEYILNISRMNQADEQLIPA